MRRMQTLVGWMVLLVGPGLALEPAQTSQPKASDPQISVSHHARSLQPGEVVLLTVTTSEPVAAVQGSAFAEQLRFYQTEDPSAWRGLIGIDLTTEPGEYPVALRATTAEGQTAQRRYTLSVTPKAFATRRLSVDPGYVTPPAEAMDRIQRESRRVAQILRAASPEKLWSGAFLAPVPGEPTSSFGRRSILNGQPRSPHSGTDFRAGEGTPIKAPNAGRVVLSSNLYFSGNSVIVDHGWGLYSYFAHLSRMIVTEGAIVAPGEIIGHVGATGRVTGPHLHWSVRLHGARVDPLSLMAALSE